MLEEIIKACKSQPSMRLGKDALSGDKDFTVGSATIVGIDVIGCLGTGRASDWGREAAAMGILFGQGLVFLWDCGRGSISIFEEFFASVEKNFRLGCSFRRS